MQNFMGLFSNMGGNEDEFSMNPYYSQQPQRYRMPEIFQAPGSVQAPLVPQMPPTPQMPPVPQVPQFDPAAALAQTNAAVAATAGKPTYEQWATDNPMSQQLRDSGLQHAHWNDWAKQTGQGGGMLKKSFNPQ
jgi:hypothetical protein